MKKVLFGMVMFVMLFSSQVFAEGTDHAYVGQVNVSAGHDFNVFGKESKNTLHAHGIMLYTTDDYLALFTYLGPKFQLTDDFSIYTMIGTFNDNTPGMSFTTSIWADYLKGKNELFAEFDYYIPIDAHPSQYYTFDQYNRFANENVYYGLTLESFGNLDTGDVYELAYGPHIQFGKVGFWFAYDQTPAFDGDKFFVRLIFKP